MVTGHVVYRFNTEDYPLGVRLSIDPAGIWLRRPPLPVVDFGLDRSDRVFAHQEAVAANGGAWRALMDRCVSPPDAMQALSSSAARLNRRMRNPYGPSSVTAAPALLLIASNTTSMGVTAPRVTRRSRSRVSGELGDRSI